MTTNDAQFPFKVGFVNQQLSYLGDIPLIFKIAEENTGLKKGGSAIYYFTSTPSTLPGSCLLRSKRILSSCLLFFILFHSSNPRLITLPIFLYLLAKRDLAATSSVFEESQKVLG